MDEFGQQFDNFLVRQIIVGNVQLDANPPKENVPADLRHLDFVGAKCSVTLVEQMDGPMKMLVDCAGPYEREELIQALKANGIADPSQITHLAITHWHIDHCGQIALFPLAKLITPEMVREKGEKIAQELWLPDGIDFAFHVGHSCGDLVVKVRQKRVQRNGDSENSKTVAIVGDLFEFQNDWKGDEPWKSISQFPDRQALARWICWKEANWIVPGHGPAFRIKTEVDLTLQTPIYGRILFDTDSRPIIEPEGAKMLAENVKQILEFSSGKMIYRIYLIQTGKSNILVNCGGLDQRGELIKALQFHGGLSPAQISYLIITRPEEQFAANLDLFGQSIIFLCHDIFIPGPFYATMDHHFIPLEGGIVSVWRDLRTNSTEKCSQAVLARINSQNEDFALIGEQIDEFILAKLEIEKGKIKLIKPFADKN